MAARDVATRLDRLRRLRLKAAGREDWTRAYALEQAIGQELAQQHAPLIRKAWRTGRSFGYFGDEVPTPANVVWGRPNRMVAKVATGSKAALAFRPMPRMRHSNRRPRSRSAKRSPRTASAPTRGDPHLAGDDDPPLADFRPSQGATAVARAFELARSAA